MSHEKFSELLDVIHPYNIQPVKKKSYESHFRKEIIRLIYTGLFLAHENANHIRSETVELFQTFHYEFAFAVMCDSPHLHWAVLGL